MEYDAIVEHLPTTGLIGKYMYLTGQGEVCPRFRFFTLIGTVGAILSRKVYIQRGSKETFPTLFPNPWVVLIAPQGKGHKSSSLRVGRKLLEALPPEKRPRMFSAKITPERLVQTLASSTKAEEGIDKEELIKIMRRKAQGCLISSELGVLLGKEKYLAGTVILLTDLYDCPDEWQSETITRGDEKLYEVCLNIMAASTPDWMQTLLPRDAFEIGFMSRLFLVPMPFGWRVRKIPKPAPAGLFDEIVGDLLELTDIKGEMLLPEQTWKKYEYWYLNLPELPPGPKAEYLERKQDHVLRLAMILQVIETRKLALEPEYFDLAMKIFTSIEPEVQDLVNYIAMEPRMRIVKRVMQKIEFEGEIVESELLNEVWSLLSRPHEFEEVILLLLKTKKIMMIPGKEISYKAIKEKGE